MPTPVGARVGAILSMTATEVHLLGFGVYDGDFEPPFGPMGTTKAKSDAVIAELKAEGRVAADYAFTNPRITLDDGRVVWGAQCWWGAEETVRARIGDRTVIPATLDSVPVDACGDAT